MLEVRRVGTLPAAAQLNPGRPTVILLDHHFLEGVEYDRRRLAELAGVAALIGFGEPGEVEPGPQYPIDLLTSYMAADTPAGAMHALLQGGFRHAVSLVGAYAAREERALRHRELAELTSVGVALSTERNLLALLEMILSQARRITSSDAASLYLVERVDSGAAPTMLRFRLSQNYSLKDLPFPEVTVPIDHSSLAGYTAATGEPLVIEDVYLLPNDVSYRQNRSFDEKFGYRTKSVLVIPLRTHRDEIIGVLQLINRKRDRNTVLSSAQVTEREVLAYDQQSVELVSALASQAAVAIENSLLYEDIERLFEGFVTAAVLAIEQRDPTTFGHSGRVANYTVGLAEVVDRAADGPFRGVSFSREQLKEIRYAGLLHDFGKVGVREQVLVKAKKLYPPALTLLRQRYAFIRRTAEREFWRRRAEFLEKSGKNGYDAFLKQLNASHDGELKNLDRFMELVLQSNEPSLLPEGDFEELMTYGKAHFQDLEGTEQPFLTADEVRFLTIRKGSLDEAERLEIESHVTHTYNFLAKIPWTRELQQIPKIAYGHHEKLDGRGYPNKLRATEIPIQTRMMTISDIYDALTAQDRPYKRAVPTTRALDILTEEVKAGQLDADLYALFVAGKVFERGRPVTD